ncbi:RNA polymerase sigma factor [Nesterenkonia ebinurensis]|uniref:RNA polymerase sigma factor n=1 Tax=Nesterenkonia ebinurensis TaxID=2608252 RepID=UPI0037C882FB
MMDERLLRSLIPDTLRILIRRGADFASAEDAVQEALLLALHRWPKDPPRDAKGWLISTAWHRFLDAARSEQARRRREELVLAEPPPGPASGKDDSLQLYLLCAHPVLTQSSAVALTLRAVGGLTTAQIAEAYMVPESTMAQRISRAKRKLAEAHFTEPGDLSTVLRVLYLIFNEGYSGEVDLVAEAIRLARELTKLSDHPEVHGLLALMLLTEARRPARTAEDGRLISLAEQDRSLWSTTRIAEGVNILQRALAQDSLGEFQAQAAIAALHADAQAPEETDWEQILQWYDELVSQTESPIAKLNRAVALGHAHDPASGLAALAQLDASLPRHTAASAYLHELNGDFATASRLYSLAAQKASNLPERHHLIRQAARLSGTDANGPWPGSGE